MNFLEELASEWYEWQGYFVRRNVLVGPRSRGGWEGELDVVGFHPERQHLVHVECSMDAASWEARDARFSRKFSLGRRHIPSLFQGLNLPSEPDQIALLGFASKRNRETVGGGQIILVQELLREIVGALGHLQVASGAIPEDKPLIRALQFAREHHEFIFGSPEEAS